MTKKLFLITTLGLISGVQLFGGEYASENRFLSFANRLKQLPSAEYKETAQWMEQTFVASDEYHQNMTDLLTSIINGNISVEQKINAITQLKTTEKQTIATQKSNTKKNAILKTVAKATAALVFTTGVICYFYFMCPWTKQVNG